MYIASAATTLKLHDFTTGELVHNYQPGTDSDGSIRSISWSKDGQWLLLVPYAGHVELVSIKGQLKLLRTIEAIQHPTCACFQTLTKKSFAIGTQSGLTAVYDIKSKGVRKEFRSPLDEITHVCFTAQDSHCVTACKNGTVFVYNCTTNGRPRQLIVPKSKTVTCLGTQPLKKNLVLGGSAEGMVVIWDLNFSKSKFQTKAHQAAVNCVSFSPIKCELISTAGQDRQCYFFDTNNGKHIANLSLQNCATSMDFTSDGKHFILGHQNGYVSIYDLRNIKEPIRSFQAHNKSVKHLSFQPSGDQMSGESDISIESTPIKHANENIAKVRFSEVFSCSFCSPEVQAKRLSEGAEGSPAVFNVDSLTNMSINNDSVCSLVSPAPNAARSSIGGLKASEGGKPQAQFSSTPKTTGGASKAEKAAASRRTVEQTQPENFRESCEVSLNPTSVQSTSTQTDPVDSNAMEDIKNELRSVTAELHSKIEYKSVEIILELRETLCRAGFYTTKNFVGLMDSVENLQENIVYLAEQTVQVMDRLDVLEDQLRNFGLI